jgi:hypothetical protein
MRSVAVTADDRDNILNERDLPVFVLIGWGDPLRAAYNERVEGDVNAKATAADKVVISTTPGSTTLGITTDS